MSRFTILLALVTISLVSADVYMHNPRGSNNRLNEQSANRNNGNRLFDSQNNNRGGYNVGDRTKDAFNGGDPTGTLSETYDPNFKIGKTNGAMQYQMLYFENSQLSIEWTAQHGCGGNEKNDAHQQNCDMILQYSCQTSADGTSANAAPFAPGSEELRDGGNTNTPDEPNNANDVQGVNGQTAQNNRNNRRGRHESEAYYYECKLRSRNKGLFTADQILNGDSAKYTRQNPNGDRRGLECPEERDYYPYWGPTPWRDIAILTDHPEKCNEWKAQSQNVAKKYKCKSPTNDYSQTAMYKAITESDCTKAGGVWEGYSHNLPAPVCQQADWSRVNHLGNGRNGQPVTYNWTLPSIDDLTKSGAYIFPDGFAKCAFRLRYNISTDDYDPYNTTSRLNHNQQAGIISPVRQNPTVDIGAQYAGLKLAINTAQFGRTFQDRSHVFYIKQRPAAWANKNIYNLNVRGKRGNIVQTFPAVEYDFVPSRFHATSDDLIHVQWTGSNTHNNGDPAGDGQAGDAGEGKTGTDRHNIAQLKQFDENYPLPLDKNTDNMWTRSVCYNYKGVALGSSTDCAIYVATSGQYRSLNDVTTTTDQPFDPLLNDAPASLIGGVVMQFEKVTKKTTFNYMCTRNNNFSNRSQKGSIVISPKA